MTRPLKVHPSIKSADLFPKMRSMKEQVRAPLLPILGALYGRFLRSKAGRPVWSFNLEALEDLIDMSSYILYQTQVFVALETRNVLVTVRSGRGHTGHTDLVGQALREETLLTSLSVPNFLPMWGRFSLDRIKSGSNRFAALSIPEKWGGGKQYY